MARHFGGRLLSLAVASILVLAMAPAVLADGEIGDVGAAFWPVAEQQFSARLKAVAGSVMWDGSPVVPFEDWLARAKDIVGMIDDPVRTSDPSAS